MSNDKAWPFPPNLGLTASQGDATQAQRLEDHAHEGEVREKISVAPRVSMAQVDAIMNSLIVKTMVIPGTTTTVAVALTADGFSLATAISACVDPRNFDENTGARIATQKVLPMARDKVWELEGYALHKSLNRVDPVGMEMSRRHLRDLAQMDHQSNFGEK